MTTKRTAKRKAAKKPAKAKALSPRAQPVAPDRSGRVVFIHTRPAGVRVTEDTALTLGAVWACVRVITESLAGLPWLVYRKRRDGGNDLQLDNTLNWLLDTQSNPETTAFTFRETLIAHVLIWGNGYAEIERDIAGRPVWLWQLAPHRVEIMRATAELLRDYRRELFDVAVGEIVYRIHNDRSEPTYLPGRDMLHVRGLGYDGLVGYSVIQMHARSIGMGIALEESGTTIFANDSTPGGLLEHPGKLSDTARKNLEESWMRRHQGPSKRRTMAILEEGMKWHQTSLPPKDAELVDQLGLTPQIIARIFRVPPHKIADLSRATFSNIEHQSIEFVEDTLRPWAERLESEANIKLFGRNNAGTLHTIIDLEERKRGDTAARTSYYRELFDRGVFSVNDIRVRENQNPIGPDGDKRFVPLNMQLLETAGEEPPPSEMPVDVPDEPAPDVAEDETDEGLSSRLQERTMGVLTDACRRMLDRESAAEKQMGALPQEWLSKHREWARDAITPAAALMSECFGANGAATEVAVSLFLDKHLADRVERKPEDAAIDLRAYLLAAAAAKEPICQP